jgi:hypothetical protein
MNRLCNSIENNNNNNNNNNNIREWQIFNLRHCILRLICAHVSFRELLKNKINSAACMKFIYKFYKQIFYVEILVYLSTVSAAQFI